MTTRTEPMISKALRMKNAMSSQSTATASGPPSDASPGLHRPHPRTRKPAATKIARSEYRPAPTAQVQDRNQRACGEHPEPLEGEDDAEPHPAVLRRPAFDELRLGLWDIEGDSLHLRDHRDREDEEAEELGAEDVPSRQRQRRPERDERPVLLLDDLHRIEGPGEDDEGDHREDHRDGIGEEHRRRAESADEGVLVVRGVPGD